MKTALSLVGLLLALPWIGPDAPRERTRRAQEAWAEGRFEAARELLDSVLESKPDSPVAQRNAGSARVAAGEPESALEPLRAAAEAPETAAAAFYDLGNAHLAAGDLEPAVEAYQEALLRRPDHLDAKHNLEVVLRRQQDQEEPREQEGEDEDGDESRDEGDEPGPGDPSSSGEGPEDPEPPDPEEGRDSESPPDAEGEATGAREPHQTRPSRLPQFQDQADMTAEEAAALLEAVENLEREQRREMIEAARAEAARQLTEGKDW